VGPYDRIELVLNGGEFLPYQGGNFNDFIGSKVFTKAGVYRLKSFCFSLFEKVLKEPRWQALFFCLFLRRGSFSAGWRIRMTNK